MRQNCRSNTMHMYVCITNTPKASALGHRLTAEKQPRVPAACEHCAGLVHAPAICIDNNDDNDDENNNNRDKKKKEGPEGPWMRKRT